MTKMAGESKMEIKIDPRIAAFARDVDRWDARETVQKLRDLKRYVLSEVRSFNTARATAAWFATWAACVSLGVRSLLQQLHDGDTRRRNHWVDESAFLMEDVVMTSYHTLRQYATVASGSPTNSSPTVGVDAAFAYLLASTVGVHTPAVIAWVELGSLLSLCWIVSKPTPTSHRVTNVLDAMAAQCRQEALLARYAAWPLFLQGLVFAVNGRDDPRARQCLLEAVAVAGRDGPDAWLGIYSYWSAVLLSREHTPTSTTMTTTSATTKTTASSAVEQLRVAVANNYSVVASLNLMALLAIQQGDLYEAAAALERSVVMELNMAISIFNYAVLLKRMGNHMAQYEMLAYYNEATAMAVQDEDADEDDARSVSVKQQTETDSVDVFRDDDMARLFLCSKRHVERRDVALHMATAATASGAWHAAREQFEAYFSMLDNDQAATQTTRRHFIYVLLQCNRPTDALTQCTRAFQEDDLWIEFYKADALLCLERVDECAAHLSTIIQPRLANRLSSPQSAENDELVALHVQLLNNLAVAYVCCGDIDVAVDTLRDCARQYPTDQAVQFNLALLLWRLERRDAACALWFKARGWSLQMCVGNMRDQQKALDFVTRMEDEALSSIGSHHQISAHVSDAASVDDQQLRQLDALVLHHWGTAQDALVAKTAAQYVEYLETLSAKSTTT